LSLNSEQKQAVESMEKKILVIAGPGSGKTRVLAHRISHIISLGANPEKIIAMSFTNKAGKEIAERCIKVNKNSEKIFSGTFHSFGVHFLRKTLSQIDVKGIKSNFTILDSDDIENIGKRILASMNIQADIKVVRKFLNYVEKSKENLKFSGIEIEEFLNEKLKFADREEINAIYQFILEYQKKTWGANLLDFTDLVAIPTFILKKNLEIRENWQKKIDHLLVDEWQDTNILQYNFAKLLSEPNYFFAVGDPDQSIYSWRGADPENLFRLKQDFPNLITYKLNQNYRSTKNILKVANSVLKVGSFEDRELVCDNENGKDPKFLEFDSPEEQSKFIAQTIKYAIQNGELNGKKFSDFAVLYRTNAQSRSLEEGFLNSSVPYKVLKGTRFFDRREIKDLISYLKFFGNKLDNLSFERIVKAPTRGIGPKTLQEIAFAGDGVYSKGLEKFAKENEKIKKFKNELDKIESLISDLLLSEFIRELVKITGFEDYVEEISDGKLEFESRKENIEEFVKFAENFNEVSNSLQVFLEKISLLTTDDTDENDNNSVKLMSLHASKGLEFKYVFLVGVNEGILPHERSINEGNVDEERRLFFVGITRAKEELFITWVRRSSFSFLQPSRFLTEIGALENLSENILEETRGGYFDKFRGLKNSNSDQDRMSLIGENNEMKNSKNISFDKDFSINDWIEHPQFGKGQITDISGNKFAINFSGKIKILAKEFLKVKKI